MQRWQALAPRFAKLGVALVAISPDTPAEVARMAAAGDLPAIRLLSDESLAVAAAYNRVHEGALTDYPRRPLRRSLMVPTTLLLDAAGRVRWSEQSDDYRLRLDAERVLAAVTRALAA